MRQKRVDLNLLNVFSAVMIEQSVTRAADRLSMTQPAVSNALSRLRLMFKDELFVKGAGGILPTERAKALWQSMRHPLEELRALAVPSEFKPATTVMTFNIAVTDSLLSRVVPLLAGRIMSEAPLARLVMHYHSNPASIAGLEAGQLDCAVGMFPSVSPDIIVETVATDDYVVVFRQGHPRFAPPVSTADFLAAKHVLVKQSFRQLGMVDAWMKLRGLEREIVVTVNSSADAMNVIRSSDLVAAVPLSYIESLGSGSGVSWAELPFEHDHISYKLSWHERTDRDQARMWLRNLARDCTSQTMAASYAGSVRSRLPLRA